MVDLNTQDSDGVTLFHLAAMRCEARMFYMLEQDADPFLLTKYGRNALHLACRARQSNVVGYLCHVSLRILYQFSPTPLRIEFVEKSSFYY